MSLLSPQGWKFRKTRRGMLRGIATSGTSVSFGSYGMKAISNGYVTSRQLEAARKVVMRSLKKVGKLWFRVFPNVPYTKKGLEMPMGSGKGDVDHYTAPIKRGRIIFELDGLSAEDAQSVLMKAGHKLPIQVKVVSKDELW